MYYEDSEHFGLVINNILAIGAARDCDVNDAIDNMWSICSCQSGFCNTSECCEKKQISGWRIKIIDILFLQAIKKRKL